MLFVEVVGKHDARLGHVAFITEQSTIEPGHMESEAMAGKVSQETLPRMKTASVSAHNNRTAARV